MVDNTKIYKDFICLSSTSITGGAYFPSHVTGPGNEMSIGMMGVLFPQAMRIVEACVYAEKQ